MVQTQIKPLRDAFLALGRTDRERAEALQTSMRTVSRIRSALRAGKLPEYHRCIMKHPSLVTLYAAARAASTTHDSMGCSTRGELTQPKQGQNDARE